MGPLTQCSSMHHSICMAPEGSPALCLEEEGASPQTSADALSTPSPPHSSSSGGSPNAAQAEAAYSRQKLKGKAVMRPGEAGLQDLRLARLMSLGHSKARVPRPCSASLWCPSSTVFSDEGARRVLACLTVVMSHTRQLLPQLLRDPL